MKIILLVFVFSGCSQGFIGDGLESSPPPAPPEEPLEPQGAALLPTLDANSGATVSRSTGNQDYRTVHSLGAPLSVMVQTGKNYESKPRGAVIPRDEE